MEKAKQDWQEKRKATYASQFEIVLARGYDFYYPTGKQDRSVFIIQNRVSEGDIVYAELREFKNQQYRRIAKEFPPVTGNSYENLKSILETELSEKRRHDTIVDLSGT